MTLAALGLIVITFYGLIDFGRTAFRERERRRQIEEMLEATWNERRAR
jgi:hypothetical protein